MEMHILIQTLGISLVSMVLTNACTTRWKDVLFTTPTMMLKDIWNLSTALRKNREWTITLSTRVRTQRGIMTSSLRTV